MGRCCVPNCRGNYDNGPKVRLFSLPGDVSRRKQWVRAIRRDDVDICTLRDPKVCELHFKPEYLRSTSSYTASDGRTVEAAMGLTRLTQEAVPTIFPNSPAYLSHFAPVRDAPEEKRRRLDASHMDEAVQLSLAAHAEEERKNKLASYGDLLSRLPDIQVCDFWMVKAVQNAVFFVHIAGDSGEPEVERSIVVSDLMEVTAFWRKVKLSSDVVTMPSKLDDMRSLESLLENVKMFKAPSVCHTDEKVKASFQLVCSLLDDITSEDLLPQEKLETAKFLTEQLHLLLKDKSALRYPAELMIFSSILYTISPHAYRFVRSTSKVTLPHPCTVMRICGEYRASPAHEQADEHFLSYIKRRTNHLKKHEKVVILMMDEIHLTQYFDYKGGSLTGTAANCSDAAKTAHVFMIQSLLSGHKDVAHILPVFSIEARQLHDVLKKVILELEKAGLTVIAVITDNNAINRKVMSMFSPNNRLGIVYPHPADKSRPLFYVVDPVHLLKCVRNNWLNEKNPGTCIFYPEFSSASSLVRINGASFKALRDIHEFEKKSLSKFGYGLTYKALHPSNIERQNVKLALKVFSPFVIEALRSLGAKLGLSYAEGTADFINVILKWWHIVNVKTPKKGRRLRDPYQEPVTSLSGVQVQFLSSFVSWLDVWKEVRMDTGALTTDTHAALRLTTYSLIEICRYCFDELHLEYVLLGKFQTDSLEERFGRYRRLCGTNYHVSIQQIYEGEAKLRLQDSLIFPEMKDMWKSSSKTLDASRLIEDYKIKITEEDMKSKESSLPAITYIAGFCAHSALKKVPCTACAENLTAQERDMELDHHIIIENLTRGGLKFPRPVVIDAVLRMQLVLEKLTTAENVVQFHASRHQRELLISLTAEVIDDEGFDICSEGHHPDVVYHNILWAAANTLLKNYVQMKTDLLNNELSNKKKQRKLKTLS